MVGTVEPEPQRDGEVRGLLARIQHDEEGLTPDEEHRFRQLLARESEQAYGMGWGELVKFAKLVHGLWLVQVTARERGTASS